MAELQGFNYIEARLRMTLDRFSNQEAVNVSEEWIEQAGEDFKAALRKQLAVREPEDFRLRMSNLGRPLCQLQHEKAGTERSRNDYNHVLKMLLGDALEVILDVVLRAADVDITAQKTNVVLNVDGLAINGQDDIEINGKVYDIKSASSWAYNNKWSYGWRGLMDDDPFGYTTQLYGYAKSTNRPMGGWIVSNKETGEVRVVEAEPTPEDIVDIEARMSNTVEVISSDAPFQRCYEDEPELFYRKETGNRVLPFTCQYCAFLRSCWPDATLKPQARSKAQNPKRVWYSEYNESEDDTS